MDTLAAGNITVVDYPCIRISPAPFRKGETIGGLPLDAFHLVVFTSKRGVTGMSDVYPQLAASGQLLAVVGVSTAKAVETHIRRPPDIIACPPTSNALAEMLVSMPGLDRAAKILHIRGDKTTGTLKKISTSLGFQLSECIVYRNRLRQSAPLALPQGKRGIVVIASPSAAEGFSQNNPGLIRTGRLQYLAIGPVTAGHLKEKKMEPVFTAPAPGPESIRDELYKIMAK